VEGEHQMLVTHPYVKNVHIEEARLADGSIDRVLVVQSKKNRHGFLNARNDNDGEMDELIRQLQSLDTLAKNGFADFGRVEIRDMK
jgi:hypothetical protein